MGHDDRRGRLLGHQVRLFGEADPDGVRIEEVDEFALFLEVGTRRVPPRVAGAPVLLFEEAGQGRAVLGSEAPLLADTAVPQFGEGLGLLVLAILGAWLYRTAMSADRGGTTPPAAR